jgi:hypothetical protein
VRSYCGENAPMVSTVLFVTVWLWGGIAAATLKQHILWPLVRVDARSVRPALIILLVRQAHGMLFSFIS